LFDPDLAVPWPISRKEMIVSERDEQAISLREKFPDQFKDQS
jgi:dTDP-4-dehydrorhamnose 3,5-epimerase-like enzyme